jgi:hypothetical protein
MNASMGKSDFAMKGTIDNYIGYAMRDELLKGDFAFNSNYLDIDQLMGPSTPESDAAPTEGGDATAEGSSEASEPLLIPGNIDFNLNTNIKELAYDGMTIKNVSGGVRIKDEEALLDNLMMNMLGGSVGMTGSYNSVNPEKPGVNIDFNLKTIDIQELVSNFVSIETLAPIAKYAKGNFSTSFKMNGSLLPSLEPIYSSLSGGGNFFTNSVEISGFKPLEKIAEAVKMDKLKNQTLKDVKAFFKFADGKITMDPFDTKLGKIPTNVTGFTSFDQSIGYDLLMNVPKEEIPASMIQLVEGAMSKVNNMVPKLNVGSLPAVIPVKVNVGGTVTDPKITTDFKDAILRASGNLKDNLIDAGKEALNKGVDSLKNIGTEKLNEVKEDVMAKKKEIMDAAQVQADKVVSEGKKAANAVRSEADKQGKALVDEAGSNPIKKKTAELAAEKLRKEAEEKAQKIEKESKAKADKIMSEAQARADKIQ